MKIPGTTIEVDDFRLQDASLHVLTHYHADHRRGLRQGEPRPILCSSLTKRLLVGLHAVPSQGCATIDPGEERRLDGGVRVRAYDANHCPGALMLLFELAGRRHLHTGDFRYAADHDRFPELFQDIDTLLVDCTYDDAGGEPYEHPPQAEAIATILDLIRRHPRHQVYLGIYTIGKNRIVQAIHEQLGLQVAMTARQYRIYELLGMAGCATKDRRATRVHAYAMAYFQEWFHVRHKGYEKDGIVILPTGWREGRGTGANFHYVPYSEHNSSSELERFIAKVQPAKIVCTNDFF